jgi:hypothetical protein
MILSLLAISLEHDFAPAAKFNNFGTVTKLIVNNLFLGAGLILFIGILMGGFNIMMHGSNPEGLKKGQKTLTYSGLGFVLIILSYFITKVILKILGIDSIL